MVQLNGTRALIPVPSASGIILAGGESRRMGRVNKALLEVGGRRIVERIALVLGHIFEEVIVVTNSPGEFAFLGLPMFTDIVPGFGALGGLYTGLHKCRGTHGFLAACDMPFLVESVIRHLVALAETHDVVVPCIQGHLEPLHAVYARGCIPHIEKLMAKSDLKILDFFREVDVLEVMEGDLTRLDPDLRFAMNLNTPQDLEKARDLAIKLDVTPHDSR
ncbi:MAG: molybdenum cofactor guanylyltransferase [Deltaproteobacteria bacterium]